VKREAQASLAAVEGRLAWSGRAGLFFSGISLGSILLLAALGLAITYGLMGVINMAHGELIMIGAYATYVVQNLFRAYLPGAFDWYLALACRFRSPSPPAVGMALERSVIRWLYGRPLETLPRDLGHQPHPHPGGAHDLRRAERARSRIRRSCRAASRSSPASSCRGAASSSSRSRRSCSGAWASSSRAHASALRARRHAEPRHGVLRGRADRARRHVGVRPGLGIAGLAAARSRRSATSARSRQSYIVDSFMVVVLGGVGQLAGTVYAALGSASRTSSSKRGRAR
jgi:urea transport system permease protein